MVSVWCIPSHNFQNWVIVLFVCSIVHQIRATKNWLSLNHSHTLDFSLSFMSVWLDCVCLRVCVRVYASVCWILTAITSDTKWLFSEGFAPFHVVIASLWWRRGPLLHAALSHDSCNIYMFTLTISICCFWNNQQLGAWREARGTAVSRAQLGFHDWGGWAWLCSSRGEGRGRGGFVFFPSRPSQGFPDVGLEESEGSGDLREASAGWDQGL